MENDDCSVVIVVYKYTYLLTYLLIYAYQAKYITDKSLCEIDIFVDYGDSDCKALVIYSMT